MRTIILGTVFALAGLVQSQNGLPQCAQTCVNSFTSGSQIGSCGSLDIKCICTNAGFLSSIACCLTSACGTADQAAAVAYAKQICITAGVTVPDAVVCVSSSTVAPTTAADSTVAPASSSIGSSTGTSVASSISMAPVSATSPSAPASSPPATKNAGIQNAAGAGMSFAGGLAAILAFW